jgi:hypothetical protein
VTSGWAGVIITGAVAGGGGLAAALRLTARWSHLEGRLTNLADKVSDLVGEIKDDRREMNERVTWLERRPRHARDERR